MLGVTEILICAVLGYHLGRGDLLDKGDDDEYPEDSDYEDEPRPAQVSENTNPEGGKEQTLFPVLTVGSSIA